ncbi:hypothetical protein E4U42_005050 [Claviceps africana]|uniref:Uncharacterized protein n=1 Tax=Claviceps africana TaxID=83212 RepID=A0A8K0NHP9_9HYPO|nr:hypothetical protein E4U42_005050 [Claviceps africana]
MEAKSLSALFDLAEHPPQYPEAPASRMQESLVLYISRVPGKRGRYVILSTVKPQERNVTGEDVTNCFYYIYLEPPTAGSAHAESTVHDVHDGPPPMRIPRKPVPNHSRALSLPAQPVLSGDPHPTAVESVNSATGSCQEPRLLCVDVDAAPPSATEQREVAPASDSRAVHDRTATKIHAGIPPRKPIGPRPISAVYASETKAAIAPTTRLSNPLPQSLGHLMARDNNDERLHEPVDERQPLLQPSTSVPQARHVGRSHAHSPSIQSRTSDRTTSRSPSPQKLHPTSSSHANGTPFSLRIIRRNPSSGAQRNVARVSSRQLENTANGDEQDLASGLVWGSSMASSLQSHPAINVEIETSGYVSFRAPSGKSDYQRTLRDEQVIISRQLLMVYTQSFTNKLQRTCRRLEQSTLNRWNRYRSNSVGSTISNGSDTADGVDEISTDGPPPPGTKARGYAFTSPWGGKCTFQTGQSGRSLICRHRPQDHGCNYNPLVADQHAKKLAGGDRMVSDLRFNLPAFEVLAERGEQWKGHLGKSLRPGGAGQAHGDGDEQGDGAAAPLGLGLGAERAGGGSRGRRAKLGKLIVYDEGLKMLDLVVAANMGLWWRAWEKNF